MACFTAPVVEAVVVGVIEKAEAKKEMQVTNQATENDRITKVPLSRKLKWLTGMLWGGSALLAFEHVWHGEITMWFPFLTAMSDPADTAEMLHEIATVGVTMALLITAVWGVMCVCADLILKRKEKEEPAV